MPPGTTSRPSNSEPRRGVYRSFQRMTISRAGVLAGLVAAVLAGPATARQQPTDELEDDPSIVVTGRIEAPPRQEVDRQAREVTVSGGDELHRPLARIEDRLCPGILGLKTEFAE